VKEVESSDAEEEDSDSDVPVKAAPRKISNVSATNKKKGAAAAKKDESEDEDMEEEKGDDDDEDESKKEIFVGNLSFKFDEDALYEHFGKYGEVTNVKLPRKPDGLSKGIAFIEFGSSKFAAKAI